MLTPGIEYFGARNDEDALAFAHGHDSVARTIVRADHLAPEGLLALLGSLLTSRPMSELMAPDAIEILDVESRPEGDIEVFVVQEAITTGLAQASGELFRETARRLRVYFAQLDDDAVVAELDALARALRELGGRLYGRRIRVPAPVPGRGARLWAAARRVAGPAGLAVAALIFIFGIPLVGGHWWLPLAISGAVAGLSLRAIISVVQRDTASQQIADQHPGGFVLTVPIDRGLFDRLTGLEEAVAITTDPRMALETSANLLVDPSGLTLLVRRARVAFVPSSLIAAIGATTMEADFGAQPEPARAVALIVLVNTAPGEAEPWLVPLGFEDRFGHEEAAASDMARVVADVLGVPAPGEKPAS